MAPPAKGNILRAAVLVPTMTFAATAEVVRYLGAIPVLVDIEPDTWCLDLDKAEAAITRPNLISTWPYLKRL